MHSLVLWLSLCILSQKNKRIDLILS